MLDSIDSVLNKYTMYRVLLYGLAALLAIATVLGLTGAVSVSSGSLLMTTAILLISCYATNKAFSYGLRVPTNTESWLISALILACILPQADSVSTALYAALAGLLAMASKFILTYRGSNILNPAAFGAFVVTIAGILPAIWWIATPWLTPFTVLLALIVLRKQRRFQLFLVFAAAAVAMLVLTGTILQGTGLASTIHDAAFSWPIIFFGSIMLTEPATLPPTRYYQLLLAVIVGLLFSSQLHVWRLETTPETVLLAGNILTLLAVSSYGALLKLQKIQRLSPDIYEVSFKRPSSFRFIAGQYAEVTVAHPHADSRGSRRTFSITSAPDAEDIRFAFRTAEKGSSFKTGITTLEPGKSLRVSHIAGDFTLPKDTLKPLLFIAGGIGITPFHSMVTSLTGRRDIILLYVVSDPQNFVYKDDFAQAADVGVKTVFLEGRLTPETLHSQVADLEQRLIYISGPDAMVRGYKKMLHGMGVRRAAIKSDYFSGY